LTDPCSTSYEASGRIFVTHFIIARRGEKMFRIKVNKITSKTSLKEFNMIAKNPADSL